MPTLHTASPSTQGLPTPRSLYAGGMPWEAEPSEQPMTDGLVDLEELHERVSRYAAAQRRAQVWLRRPWFSLKKKDDRGLLARLRESGTLAEWSERIEEGGVWRSRILCEALCEASREAAEAGEAGDLAELAVQAAELLVEDSIRPEPTETTLRPTSARNLLALALAHRGNAHRRAGDLRAAGKDFQAMNEAAHRLEGEVEWEDDYNYYCPIALSLEATYLRAVRRLPEAISRHMAAVDIVSSQLSPAPRDLLLAHLLVALAFALREQDHHEQAYALLSVVRKTWRRELATHPRLRLAVHANLADCLSHLGQQRAFEARRMMRVAERFSEGARAADRRRLEWTAARIAWADGAHEQAFHTLGALREQYIREGEAFDAALTSLELASWRAQAGQLDRACDLARETLPLFEAEGVHREALAAASFLRAQLDAGASMALNLTAVLGFLQRSRCDASQVFSPPAS